MELVETPVIILAKRIYVLISVTGLTRQECHEVIMQGKNIPTEEEFYLAWNAAWLKLKLLNREFGIEVTPE